MGFSWSSVLMVAIAIASIALEGSTASAKTHVVGDSTGWNIPPNASFYADWAATQSFAVGDVLQFNFSGLHSVVAVAKADYDSCKAAGTSLTSSPVSVTLTEAGVHYFICGISGHCTLNQKLAVSVMSGSPTAPPPSSGTPPSSGSPTVPVGNQPPSSESPTSAPRPSAGSRTTVGLFSSVVAVLSVALSFAF